MSRNSGELAGAGDAPARYCAVPRAAMRHALPIVAIVGRPNVGKSSLLNALLGQERVIVSDVPGTTRDAIDTLLDWDGHTVRLVDTAGIRRRGKVASGPDAERFSALRALKAIGRADVCILVVDATEGLAAQDAHVAGHVVGIAISFCQQGVESADGAGRGIELAGCVGEAFLHILPK